MWHDHGGVRVCGTTTVSWCQGMWHGHGSAESARRPPSHGQREVCNGLAEVRPAGQQWRHGCCDVLGCLAQGQVPAAGGGSNPGMVGCHLQRYPRSHRSSLPGEPRHLDTSLPADSNMSPRRISCWPVLACHVTLAVTGIEPLTLRSCCPGTGAAAALLPAGGRAAGAACRPPRRAQ